MRAIQITAVIEFLCLFLACLAILATPPGLHSIGIMLYMVPICALCILVAAWHGYRDAACRPIAFFILVLPFAAYALVTAAHNWPGLPAISAQGAVILLLTILFAPVVLAPRRVAALIPKRVLDSSLANWLLTGILTFAVSAWIIAALALLSRGHPLRIDKLVAADSVLLIVIVAWVASLALALPALLYAALALFSKDRQQSALIYLLVILVALVLLVVLVGVAAFGSIVLINPG